MKKTDELVVHFEQQDYKSALIFIPAMTLAMAALLFFYSNLKIVFSGWPLLNAFILYGILAIKIFLYIGLGFFLIMLLLGLLYAPFFFRYKGPAAVLDKNGIWIKHYNFIPWEEIEEVSEYSIVAAMPLIKIQVKDIATLSKQSNWDGKLRIFQAKLFKTPHITLGNLDTENENIIIFAHRYLKDRT